MKFKKYRIYIVTGAIYVVLALLVIHFFPIQITNSDVPFNIKEADSYLLKGENPYGQNYTIDQRVNPYNPNENNIVTVRLLQYPPAMIIYYIPFYLLGDVRYGNLVADITIYALIIAYFKEKKVERRFSLLFLGNGLNFIMNYFYGGNDIVAGLFVALSIYLLRNKGEKLSSLSYGVSLVTKQLSLLLIPYFIWKSSRKLQYVTIAFGSAIVILIPFLPAVFYNTVLGIFYSRLPLLSYLLIFYPFIFMVVVEKYAPYLYSKTDLNE